MKIFDKTNSKFDLKLKEALHINSRKPNLNVQQNLVQDLVLCNNKIDHRFIDSLEFFSDCLKTRKICDKAADILHSVIHLFLNALKLKK